MNYYKTDKMAGFFHFGWKYGYKSSELWKMMLTSKAGRGILSGDRNYTERYQGSHSLDEAIAELKPNINVTPNYDENLYDLSVSLANFIESIHESLGIEYSHMFDKYPIDDFVNDFGFALGEYDEKLARAHLL